MGLNELFELEGLDLRRSRLLRHQDSRALVGKTPYDLWVSNDQGFELYQKIQRKDRFSGVDTLVSFVVTPAGDTLFVGIFRITGVGTAPTGLEDPVHGQDVGGFKLYDIEPIDLLANYSGRLTIDWGLGYIAWMQCPMGRDKAILAI